MQANTASVKRPASRKRTPAEVAEKKRLADEKNAEAARKREEKKRLADEKKAEAARKQEEKKRLAEAAKRAKEAEQAKQAEALRRAGDPATFLSALTAARSASNQLVGLSDIVKSVAAAERKGFRAHWANALESASLPTGVGSLVVAKGKTSERKVFLLSDMVVSSRMHGVSDAALRQLKERLLAEFDRLSEATGGRFYVSLFDLRTALPDVPRPDFDRALNELRRDWTLTLTPAEGRHEAIAQHVLDAGVAEQSRVLVYVARRGA